MAFIRLRPFALAPCIVVVVSACAEVKQIPIRTSSAERVQSEQMKFHVDADASTVERKLAAIVEGEGLSLANKIAVKTGGTVWVFRAERSNMIDVQSNRRYVTVESHGIGSWLAARVTSSPAGTEVYLLAKPTIDGVELCSNADAEFKDAEYWCKDTLVREDFNRRSLLDGRLESELVVRVGHKLRGISETPAPAAPGATKI